MWQVEHACPQCSAPVTLEETDRLFTCPFCKVRLYMASDGALSYYLDPKTPDPDTLYVPYGRFRGMGFAVGTGEAGSTVIDGTSISRPMPPCPESLAVRPQAVKLHLSGEGRVGRFVPPSPAPLDEAALAGLTRALPAFAGKNSGLSVLWRFLREAGGLIYSPFSVMGRDVIDGVTRQKLGTLPDGEAGVPFQSPGATKPPNDVVYLPALCPNCGADLAAAPESVALPCTNCGLLWEPSREGMAERPYSLVPAPQEDALFLPFWRMLPRVEGLESTLHVDPLKHIPPAYGPPKPTSFPEFSLWAPAFFINPVLFLRLCERATMWQPSDCGEKGAARTVCPDLYPVTLPGPEARKLLSLILTLVVADRGRVLPSILRANMEAIEQSLVYLPFEKKTGEATCAEMRAAVELNALKYGRNL
jgi:DNA-directed RNA polymerase subunit RPC12/RpoP